jgi:hypothetical protein
MGKTLRALNVGRTNVGLFFCYDLGNSILRALLLEGCILLSTVRT